jgi:O-glycosyl hydrolase
MRLKNFLIMILIAVSVHAQTIAVNIDADQKYQIIDNFSASDCWWAHKIGDKWSAANLDSLADLLFSTTKGIGLSAWRFNLGAGIDANITDSWRTVPTFETAPGKYDWTRNLGGQWFLKAAKDRGVNQFIAFVNSPPKNMTNNGHTYCNSIGSTNLNDTCYGKFSTYLVDIIKHFRDSVGINFDYISPVNEPQWEWTGTSQEGNRASNDDIKRIVDSLYVELNNQNVSSQIVIPESGELPGWYATATSISGAYGETYGNYLSKLFGDSDVASKTAKIFAGHSYWSDLLSSEVVQARQSLYGSMKPYFSQGYKYWQTEYCILEGTTGQGGSGRDLTMTTALDVARIIHYDLTAAYASAWQWWLAVSKYDYKDGLIFTNYGVSGTAQSIIPSKTFWALGNYSRYIRPGSQRIECSGANDKNSLMASAYIDSAKTKIIVVMVNVGSAGKDIKFNFSGLDSSQVVNSLTPYITSNVSGDNLKAYPAVPIDSVYTVPAKSVVTMIGMLDGSTITGVKINKKDIPEGYCLDQNYPNPFNPTTTISYSIPKMETGNASSVPVELNIYDTLGRKISTLVSGEKSPGNYQVEFKANGLSSGIYFYQLSAGNFISTKKMVVLK